MRLTIAGVSRVLIEMSVGVQTIFFQGARSTICGGFRIEPEIEFVPRIVGELRIVGLRDPGCRP